MHLISSIETQILAEPAPERYFTHEAGVTVPKEVIMIGCFFFFDGTTFDMTDQEKKKLESRVTACGGQIETTYSDRVTHVVSDCQGNTVTRQGLQEGKRIVSLYWLDDVYKQGKMFVPNKAWHLPKTDIQPPSLLSKEIVSTTGFSIDERANIRVLCTQIGCRYTPYMSTKNTVLVAKKVDGEKYNKALDWLIPVVSGQWVTDAFLGVNNASARPFGNHQRHKRFDAKSEHFDLDMYSVRHLLVGWKIPIKVSEEQVKEALERKKKLDETASCSQASDEKSSQETEIMSTSMPSQDSIVQSSQADTFVVNPPQNNQLSENTDLKRTSENNDDDVFMKPLAKKAKIATSPALEPMKSLSNGIPPPPPLTLGENVFKILFTGIRQSEQPRLEEIVRKLGAKVTTNPSDCTHVVIERPVRTPKYLSAMSHTNFIVSKLWVIKSGQAGRFLNELKYAFVAVQEALKRRDSRGENGRFLFKNMVFFITPGVIPSPSVIKPIIESAGGIAVTHIAPNAAQLKRMSERNQEFIVISTENDGLLCENFHKNKVRKYYVTLLS